MSPTLTSEDEAVEARLNAIMADIRNYNEDQLNALLGDESRLDSLVAATDLQGIDADKLARTNQCRALANSNIAMRPKYDDLQQQLRAALAECRSLHEEVGRLSSEVGTDQTVTSRLDTIIALLQAATRKVEDESELLADQLLDGALSVEDFVQQFTDQRALYHTRKVKTDKIAELMRTANSQPYRPVSQPIFPHPSTGFRHVGPNIYDNRNSSYY